MTWVDNSGNESGFEVQRKQGAGGQWQLIADLGSSATTYSNSGLLADTEYYYQVRSKNAAGASAYCSQASGRTGVALVAPAAPSGLAATAISFQQVNLSWTDNSTNESGFRIERMQGAGGQWALVTVVGGNVTTYNDTGLWADTDYSYRVQAENAAGVSVFCAPATTRTSAVVYLTPGTGWTGPTTQPAAVGTPGQAGYDAKAIARWDVVPYQTFTTDFAVGIPAFHINGIDRVEFSVNSGPWMAVRKMTLNPQSNVVEYWAMLKASEFAQDGAVEVRAVAYPTVGVARVLDSLALYANCNGTLTPAAIWVSTTGSNQTGDGSQAKPFATIEKATEAAPIGGDVCLMPGQYLMTERIVGYRNDGARWVTVRPAPGVTRQEVAVIVGNSSMRAGKLHLRNVKLDFTAGCPMDNSGRGLWLDNCDVFGVLQQGIASQSFLQGYSLGPTYITDSRLHDLPATPMTDIAFVQNSTIEHCWIHGANNPQMMVNTTIHDIQVPNPADHGDGLIWYVDGNDGTRYGDWNGIVYNVTMTDIAGLLLLSDRGITNLAVVNVTGTASGDCINGASQFGKGIQDNRLDHLVFDRVTLTNQKFYFIDDTPNNVWSNSVIRNSVAQLIFSVNPNNHIINCRTTSGTPIPDK
ncbi:MAG: fibronectin type III domain-containing protein, partial [Planctomycetota bacterium]|nr:fibronectin type III domain-containing protein [Planctomycetota bacterium]